MRSSSEWLLTSEGSATSAGLLLAFFGDSVAWARGLTSRTLRKWIRREGIGEVKGIKVNYEERHKLFKADTCRVQLLND